MGPLTSPCWLQNWVFPSTVRETLSLNGSFVGNKRTYDWLVAPFVSIGLYGVKGTNLRLKMRRSRLIELRFLFFVICSHIPSSIQLIDLTLCLIFFLDGL